MGFDTIYFVGIFSQQGLEASPTSWAGRVIFLAGFAFGLLCFGSFQANIISTLSSVTAIRSFDELVNFEGISIFTSHFPSFRTEISHSQAPRVQKMWSKSVVDMESTGEETCSGFYQVKVLCQ